MDELADRLRMDPLEFRLRNLPPRRAERAVARSTFRSARRRSAGAGAIRPAIRRRGPIKRGLGCAANRWGGGGDRQTRAHCEIHPDGSVVDADRHAGHRHRHAHARRDDHGGNDGPAARRRSRGDRRHATIRSRPAAAAASPSASVSPAVRVAAENARRRAVREGRAARSVSSAVRARRARTAASR